MNYKVLSNTINTLFNRYTIMNNTTPKIFKSAYIVGLVLCALSFGFFFFTNQSKDSFDIFGVTFFINYCLAAGYLLFIWIAKLVFPSPRPTIPFACWINVVVLFTISAFSLNTSMSVFATFPTWMNVITVSMVFLFFAFPFINQLPKFIKAIVFLLTGTLFIFSLYMFIFLIPMIPVSVLVAFFLGISAHTFVPAAWIWVICDFMIRKSEKNKIKHLFWVGTIIPLFVLGFYLYKWNDINKKVNEILSEKNLQIDHQVPEAIYIAQKLPSDPITEEILMSGFKSQRFFGDNMGGFDVASIGMNKFHDPLALIALSIYGEPKIDETTVKEILNIRRDFRHRTGRRLWSGNSLSTASVSNNIEIFPEYRIAYQEKTFVIHNDPEQSENDFWFRNNTEEAIYTFHVPEGSIVTSLSLWINGKEQKSRLTTGQKADSAYTQIVGVEQRDPAVVHWQEGNTIRVNVFPCTEKENRTFKIGFTTPLSIKDGKMWLENVWFEGPQFNSCTEATRIIYKGKSENIIEMPREFEMDAKGDYIYKGEYNPTWKVAMQPTPLSINKFSFNGYDYSLKEFQIRKEKIGIQNVYLDITKEWTHDEYLSILQACKQKDVYTWLPEKVKISDANAEKVWGELGDNQFSIPFLYDIKNPSNTIIVSKTGPTSPLLSEMKPSDYADKTTAYLRDNNMKINVLNIGYELSPLWRSLHELRLINYSSGNCNEIISMINGGEIISAYEDSSIVSLNESKISIVKEKSMSMEKGGKAPDHLLRLFAYNDLLRKIGPNYFEKEKYELELFREAEEAYVVSPISSMIVLESEHDYERMGIKENVNTVGNAGIIGGGAVPEPHEWLLIALVGSFIVFKLITKRRKVHGN